MRIWIVLPALNEATNIPPILESIRETAGSSGLDCRLILVDDGSVDSTIQVARSSAGNLPLLLIENVTNRGLAVTFRRGMIAAAQQAADDDVIVCMDADNSHLPNQIPQMLAVIESGKDVVVASRYRPGTVVKGVPRIRRLMSTSMSILFRLIYPVPGIRDYSCGYRAYRAAFFKLALRERGEALFAEVGFACMVGILLHLHKLGARFGEVPLVLRYDRKIGESKMKVGRTVLRTLAVLFRERFSR